MKRIYVSFFTTVTIALTMTLIAFLGRDKLHNVVTMENNSHAVVQDSAFLEFTIADGLFN